MLRRTVYHAVATMTVAAAALLLSSCGGAGSPELSVAQGELGVFNALPLFMWTSSVAANIKDAEYTLDDGATWIPIGPGVSEFRPDAPLPAGSYTLSLRYRTWSGWSDSAAESFTVQEISAYAPNDTYYDADQWALPLIDMPLAWGVLDALFPGRDEVVVAVVLSTWATSRDVAFDSAAYVPRGRPAMVSIAMQPST